MEDTGLGVLHPKTMDRSLQILLVEDSEGDALLAKHQLARSDLASATLEVVRTLDEAAGWLLDHHVDCVLLDLSLPDADDVEGVGVIATVAPAAPIVVLTGNEDESLQVKALECGAEDYLVKGGATPDTLSRAVRYSISRKRVELELARRERFDPLTDLPNLRSFKRAVDAHISAGTSCGALLVDIRSMRMLNETHGHRGGDQLLIGVAKRLSSMVRNNDMVARVAGDKFGVVVPGCEDNEVMVRLARQILLDSSAVVGEQEELVAVPVSVAIVHDSKDFPDAESLVAAAERTVKFAGARERGWEVVSREVGSASRTVEIDLGEIEERVWLRLTPVVTMPGGQLAGLLAEPAATLEEKERVGPALYGRLQPEQRVALYRWTIRSSLEALATLKNANNCPGGLWVQIGLDARALDSPAVHDELSEVMIQTGISGGDVVLDLEAGTVVATANETFDRLRRLEVGLCVDDIGSAISAAMRNDGGLVRYVRLPTTWTAALSTEFEDRKVVRAVLAAADAMRVHTIASGVANRDQRELLIDAGCRLGIGDYLGSPSNCEALLNSMERRELTPAAP